MLVSRGITEGMMLSLLLKLPEGMVSEVTNRLLDSSSLSKSSERSPI
jgi:hypothetical protein